MILTPTYVETEASRGESLTQCYGANERQRWNPKPGL